MRDDGEMVGMGDCVDEDLADAEPLNGGEGQGVTGRNRVCGSDGLKPKTNCWPRISIVDEARARLFGIIINCYHCRSVVDESGGWPP